MVPFSFASLFCALLVQCILGAPQHNSGVEPDPSAFLNVTFGGKNFVNKGQVAFGLIPSNFKESTGDTFGGVGSAIGLERGSWKKNGDGTFQGTLVVQPDRGFNVITTIDYQTRQHLVPFTLTPYYATAPLTFNDSQSTLQLTYHSTLLYTEREKKPTTGLDSLAIRPAAHLGHFQDPIQPVANQSYNRLTVDAEGLVLNKDASFWVSDEYGPYIHQFSPSGALIRSIQPPKAILPFQSSSNSSAPVLNFTASVDPTTGRAGNQGLEGLTASPSGSKLFALLQSATIQDGGSSKSTSRFTRLLEYDVSTETPQLKGEYVVPLPQKVSSGSKNGNTFAQSEVHYLSDTQFLTLARDGNGNGGGVGSESSSYKSIDLFDISQATNIAHTKFDDPSHPIAVNGTLDASIIPAVYQPFVSLINDTQLARFGLHNGKPIDPTLVNSKWESIALAPAEDPRFPNDYFLFTVSDNDFLTTDGVAVGQPYDAGSDVDSQFMVFRVTLPSVARGSVEQSIGV